MHERLLPLSDVMNRTGLKKTAVYAAMRAGQFPRQVRISHRVARWPESKVQAWIDERVAEAST